MNSKHASSNGAGPVTTISATTRADLLAQLAHHERMIEAIKLILNTGIVPSAHFPTALKGAIALDAQRRASHAPTMKRPIGRPRTKPPTPKKKRAPQTGAHTARLRAQRQRSADFLSQFDQFEPRPAPKNAVANGIGALVARGYIQKVGPGQYIRTTKPFSLDLPKPQQEA